MQKSKTAAATVTAPVAEKAKEVKPKYADYVKNRYTCILLFDCKNGNPNGDPAAGNLPRTDAETGHGFVSDVCLKRKIRNYVQLIRAGVAGSQIFIADNTILNRVIEEAHVDNGVDLSKDLPSGEARRKKGTAQNGEVDAARVRIQDNYWDVRAMGGVMSTGANAGQVTGPVQVTIAESFDRVQVEELTITRCAVASEAESVNHNGANQTMGMKYMIPYALFAAKIYISPSRAEQTGFSQSDLELLFNSLQGMWDHDRSASRGTMGLVKLIIFKHASPLGNASDRSLEDRVTVKKNVETPRNVGDYDITINRANMPAGIELMVF